MSGACVIDVTGYVYYLLSTCYLHANLTDQPVLLRALETVPDVPEAEFTRLVKERLEGDAVNVEAKRARTAEKKKAAKAAAGPQAMDIDVIAPTATTTPVAVLPTEPVSPSLQVILAALVAYPTSPSPLRLALRMHLTPNVSFVVSVLQTLSRWLDGWFEMGLAAEVKEQKQKDQRPEEGFKVALLTRLMPPLANVRILALIDIVCCLLTIDKCRFWCLLKPS